MTGEKRVMSLPDVPTLKEQGIDVVVTGWQGLFAPAKTPEAILDKVEKATKAAMKGSEVGVRHWAATASSRRPSAAARNSPGSSQDEHEFWGKTLKELNIEME